MVDITFAHVTLARTQSEGLAYMQGGLMGCHSPAAMPPMERDQTSSEQPAFLPHKKKAGVASNPDCVSPSQL